MLSSEEPLIWQMAVNIKTPFSKRTTSFQMVHTDVLRPFFWVVRLRSNIYLGVYSMRSWCRWPVSHWGEALKYTNIETTNSIHEELQKFKLCFYKVNLTGLELVWFGLESMPMNILFKFRHDDFFLRTNKVIEQTSYFLLFSSNERTLMAGQYQTWPRVWQYTLCSSLMKFW